MLLGSWPTYHLINLRNWCLTQALTLEGRIDGARLEGNHRFSPRRQIEGWSVELLYLMLESID